jgi:hypothetical protein
VKFRRVSAVWNNKNLSFVLPRHFNRTEICFGNDQNYKAVSVAIFGRDKCVCESYELTIVFYCIAPGGTKFTGGVFEESRREFKN